IGLYKPPKEAYRRGYRQKNKQDKTIDHALMRACLRFLLSGFAMMRHIMPRPEGLTLTENSLSVKASPHRPVMAARCHASRAGGGDGGARRDDAFRGRSIVTVNVDRDPSPRTESGESTKLIGITAANLFTASSVAARTVPRPRRAAVRPRRSSRQG